MFYDNFTPDQICGMFSFWHIVAIVIFAVTATIALVLSRNMKKQTVVKLMKIVAITVVVMEIVKITLRLIKHSSPDGWVPLYFCSLFLYAICFALCKNEFIKNMGYCFLVCGGIVASVCYTIYPSTALLLYPIWHPSSIHGFVYHWFMFYIGVLVAMRGLYHPKAKDFVYYLSFTTIFTLLALIVNNFTGSNLMLISRPFGVAFFYTVYNISPFLYGLMVYLAQSVGLFWAVYGVYKIGEKIANKKQPKTDLVEQDKDDEPNLKET